MFVMNHRISYSLVIGLTSVASAIPIPVSTWIARRIGDLIYFLFGKRRKTALDNLEKAFGDMSERNRRQIARQSFQNMAVSAAELFMMARVRKEAERRFESVNFGYLHAELKKGKGVILVCSHLGSWEYLAFLSHLEKVKLSVVVRDIKNPQIDHEVNELRKVTGLTTIPKKSSIKEVMKRLKNNEVVVILIDQWAGPEGIWQDFFGVPTSTTSIPVRLALRSGSALIPAFCLRKSAGFYRIEVCPPV